MKTTYRIVTLSGLGLPVTVDTDGYETRLAAEAMADTQHDGEYRIEPSADPSIDSPPIEITVDQLRALRTEAGVAGDSEQVAICSRALDGDEAARAECARVIAEAQQA